jgi:hypothetical protein
MKEVARKTARLSFVVYLISFTTAYLIPNPHKQDIVYVITFSGATIFNSMIYLWFWTQWSLEQEILEIRNERKN